MLSFEDKRLVIGFYGSMVNITIFPSVSPGFMALYFMKHYYLNWAVEHEEFKK